MIIKGLRHDHIDGSKAVLEAVDQAVATQIENNFNNVHIDIVQKFSLVTSQFQNPDSLYHLGYTYARYRALEGYVYVEAKFAPQYHTQQGLSIAEVGRAVYEGLKAGVSDHKIHIVPQFCIGREAPVDTGLEVARAVLEYDGEVMLDLACDESGHPPEKHLPAYQLTFGTKVRRDCHAGEWVSRLPKNTYRQRLLDNVRTAVRVLKCHQVGHAIPLCDDPELVKEVVDLGIIIAGCPLSNVTCGALVDVRHLRINELLDAGVRYTLNSDDDLFLPDMNKVVTAIHDSYGLTDVQWKRLAQTAIERG